MKKLSKKERNAIYRQALELNVSYDGFDRAVKYLKTELPNYDNKRVRKKFYPEISIFDYKINYSEISKYEAMKIRDIAFMFCIEMTS